MIYFLIVLLDQVMLFLINMCCYCSGSGREKKWLISMSCCIQNMKTCMVKGFRIWRYTILFIADDGFCKIEIILN